MHIVKNLIYSVRFLLKNKLFTFINVIGLSTGVSVCFLALDIAHFQLNFDTFQTGYHQVFRIYTESSDGYDPIEGSPTAVYWQVKEQFKDIESLTNVFTLSPYYVSDKLPDGSSTSNSFEKEGIILTGPDYFKVFDFYEWIAGNPENSLNKPNHVVITESRAKLYFGDISTEEILKKDIHYNDSLIARVSGIVKDPPINSDFIFTDFISESTIHHSWLDQLFESNQWNSVNSSSQLFVRMARPNQEIALQEQLNEMVANRKKESNYWSYHFKAQPLSDLHYNTNLELFYNRQTVVDKKAAYSLVFVALLIITIAIINFTNLIAAQESKRMKEAGVKKVYGSSQKQLIVQFLSESFMVTTFSVIISMVIILWFFSQFKGMMPNGYSPHFLNLFSLIFFILCLTVIPLLSGLYGALKTSFSKPVADLNKNTGLSKEPEKRFFRRNGLIIVQFSISVFLVIITIVTGLQVNYIITKDLGYDPENIIYIHPPNSTTESQRNSILSKLQNNSRIVDVVLGIPPAPGFTSMKRTRTYNREGNKLNHSIREIQINGNYIQLFKFQLLYGKNIGDELQKNDVLINEYYMRMLGYNDPEKIIGEEIDGKYTISGVVKNFNTKPLNEDYEPVLFIYSNRINAISIRFSQTEERNLSVFLSQIAGIWKETYPNDAFNFTFLEERILEAYKSEMKTLKLALIASVIALIINIIGLFGLTLYNTRRRMREIGIRKALGSPVSSLTGLLYMENIYSMFIAFMVAVPFAWHFSNQWLNQYTFKWAFSPWIFTWAGLLIMALVFLATGPVIIKAAKANPVDVLREG